MCTLTPTKLWPVLFLQCVAGYHGANCSEEINECLSQPCQNGGTCIDLTNTYKCSCPRGTQGKSGGLGRVRRIQPELIPSRLVGAISVGRWAPLALCHFLWVPAPHCCAGPHRTEYSQYHPLIMSLVTLQVYTVRSMLMTAIPPLTLPLEAPSASTMAPVWTRWVAIAAPAHQASSGSGVRAMSMSASPTPVTRMAPRTACSGLMTSTASAGLATLVRVLGRWAEWGDGQWQQGVLLTYCLLTQDAAVNQSSMAAGANRARMGVSVLWPPTPPADSSAGALR